MKKTSFLSTRPEILSVENIAEVRNRLSSLGALSHSLERCLDHAMVNFSREDNSLQKNSQLIIHCKEKRLEFVSGKGGSHIEVSLVRGNPCYKVELSNFGDTVKKSPCGRLLLSVENLEKAAAEMISWREMTKGLKASLENARDHFSKEPIEVQQNCFMVVQGDGRKVELISGDGHNAIHIFGRDDLLKF